MNPIRWILAVAVAVPTLLPTGAFAAQRNAEPATPDVLALFPDATAEQAKLRAALVDASWDLPQEVLERIQGVGETNEEHLSAVLPRLVNPSNANVRIPLTDLRIGAPGPSADVRRMYNSRDDSGGNFGTGWSWGFGARLRKTGTDLTLTDDDGGALVFTPAGARVWRFLASGDQILQKGDGYLRTSAAMAEAERYDRNGYLVERIGADGRKVTIRRDTRGTPTAIIAANGRQIRIRSDRQGRITEMVDDAGRKATYEYEGARLVRSSVDGLLTKYEYDEEARLSAVTFPSTSLLTIRYNAADWVEELRLDEQVVRATFSVSASRPDIHGASLQFEGETTRYEFDEAQGTTRIVYPSGMVETRKVDPACGCLSEAEIGGQKATYRYDQLGRLVMVAAPDGTIRMAYGPKALKAIQVRTKQMSVDATFDAQGNLVRTEGRGLVQEFAYDDGLITRATLNGKVVQTIGYDRFGDPVSFRDLRGRETKVAYDAAGMVKEIQRDGHTKVEIAHQTGRYVPKIRLSIRTGQGTQTTILANPEMAFLYGDLAGETPIRKASLDSIPGVKLASLAGAPIGLPVILAARECGSNTLLCGLGVSANCFGAALLDAVSPVGSPIYFDPETGTSSLDPGRFAADWGLGKVTDSWGVPISVSTNEDGTLDVSADVGKEELTALAGVLGREAGRQIAITNGKGGKKKSGFWRRVADRALRNKGKALRVLGKIAKGLAKPIAVIMLVKDAYDCGVAGADAQNSAVCNP